MRMLPLSSMFISLVLTISTLSATSITEQTSYQSICKNAVENDEAFAHFRQTADCIYLIDTVSFEHGLDYLKYIQEIYPELLASFDTFRTSDSLGDPVTYEFEKVGEFCPTTLRYIKTAGDLQKQCGGLKKLHIVEIGAGYGGQCKIIHDLGGCASYTIVDLPECNALTKKYLTQLGINNVIFIDNDKLSQLKTYDLIISNYSFSEMGQDEQLEYLDLIIDSTPNGYMMMNFVSEMGNFQTLPINTILARLYQHGRDGKIEKERPTTHENNLLITWKVPQPAISAKPALPLYPAPTYQKGNAITFTLGEGSRLGDNLIAYLHAKWISYKYGIPLLNIYFPFSNEFYLFDFDQLLSSSYSFRNIVQIKDETEIKRKPSSTLYVVRYAPECRQEYDLYYSKYLPFIEVNWDDPGFKSEVIRSLQPKKNFETLNVPTDCISVCVHVRRGGDVDSDLMKQVFPLKFPPDSYYIQQIQRIVDIFPNQRLYVYVMTDDLNPQAIVDKFSGTLNNPNLEFACRTTSNSPRINVFEDFYSISKFDCLIRSQSNFAFVGSLLSNFKIVTAPTLGHYENGQFIIDEVKVTFNGAAQ